MKDILKTYDGLLNNKNSSYITKAINGLHFVKLSNNKNFQIDTNNQSDLKSHISYFKILQKFLKRNFDFIIHLFKKEFFFNKKNNKINESDILIISHCLKENVFNLQKDFYFGELSNILSKKKLSYCKLLINHTNRDSWFLNKKNNFNNQIILEKYLTFFGELKLFILQIKEFLKLKKIENQYKSKKKKINLKKIIFSLFDGETKFSLRMYFLIKLYVQKIKPKYLIYTYEGYSWERLCVNAVKKYNPNIKCIGYQHALVSKINYAMRRNIKGNFNPDIVWASGKNSYNILKKSRKLKKTKIINIGYLKKIKFYKKKVTFRRPSCLVIPEGIYSECFKLFNFSLQCAKKNKFINFIWRVHPIIDWKVLEKILDIKSENIPKNIKISKNSFLRSDVTKCSYVLYRGSAAVVEAITGGNYPIYLNFKKEPNIDPIYKYKKNTKYVDSVEQFLNLFQYSFEKKKLKNTHIAIKKIHNDIYSVLNQKKLLNCLGIK